MSKLLLNFVTQFFDFLPCISPNNCSDADFPLTQSSLLLLSNVREITGYLSVDGLSHGHDSNVNITDLRFLRRLQVIRGRQTLYQFNRHYSLVVQNNPHLLTLNLASLQRIENGWVRVDANPALCLVDTIAFESYLVGTNQAPRIGGLGHDCTGEWML